MVRDSCEGWWEAILLCKIFKINSYFFPIFSGKFLFFSCYLGARIPIFLFFWPFLLRPELEIREREQWQLARTLLKQNYEVKSLLTRMHSSRMRTVRCSGRLIGGCLPGGGGVHLPSVDRILDTHLWKHYLSATSYADGIKSIDVLHLGTGPDWRVCGPLNRIERIETLSSLILCINTVTMPTREWPCTFFRTTKLQMWHHTSYVCSFSYISLTDLDFVFESYNLGELFYFVQSVFGYMTKKLVWCTDLSILTSVIRTFRDIFLFTRELGSLSL